MNAINRMIMKRSIYLIAGLLCLGGISRAEEPSTVRINKCITIYTDIMRQLDMNYTDTLDYDQLTKTGIQQMLYRIDPYTVYIPKEEDESLRMMTTGNYGGVGAIIMQRDSVVMISEPYKGMPAEENDVQAGDIILEVDGMDCFKKTTKEVSDRLRGKAGTEVSLKLKREGVDTVLIRRFNRREIHLPAVTYYTALDDKRTGYILFSEFTSSSAQDFLVAVEDMVRNQGIKQLIIDLRGNGGGIIDEAIRIVGYFVDKGTDVVSTKGKIPQSNRVYTTSTTPLYRDMPLMILVDGQTASAAEIVSGSLQDLKRATLIGQRTYGKGLVQSIRPVAFDGHLKVTTAHYYLPSGRCIQAIDYSERQKGNELKKDTAGGILPDIVLTDSDKVDITYSLYRKQLFFDYATRYHATHKTIASPETFTVSDEELEDFIRFLGEKKYSYETETAKYIDEVLDVASHEDIDSTFVTELRALKERMTPDYREVIMRRKDEVKQVLGEAIVERYYYQQGRVAFLLRYDKGLKRALEAFETASEESL